MLLTNVTGPFYLNEFRRISSRSLPGHSGVTIAKANYDSEMLPLNHPVVSNKETPWVPYSPLKSS